MKLLEFKIKPDEEIMEVLIRKFKERKLTRGAIISVIGATESCMISNTPDDPKVDVTTEYNVPLELSGNGEIRDGKPHIHCTLSSKDNIALHGHLHWAKVRAWYITVFVVVD